MKEKIMIVEDQFIEANNLQMILERAGYYVCSIARSVQSALTIIEKENPGLVLLDIYLQGPLTGIDLAKTLNEKNIPFVYLSANSNKEVFEAAKATQPYGFLVKPFREKDVLVTLDIAKYFHEHSLESRLKREPGLKGQLTSNLPETARVNAFNSAQLPKEISGKALIGKSKALHHILDLIKIVSPLETSVLILGESGTGKERIADYIHHLSPKNAKPFIKVNCGALPDTLIESELFGHERGAFTGATEKRIGKFEQAGDGTIFLDEIGEMPFELQVKLLRVLQEKEIERLGGNSTIKINARVIAATNKDLESEVANGRFRIDLYYRLNVFPIQIPALRSRKEDIPDLVTHFINYYSRRAGKNIKGISEQAMQDLMVYEWPGNIRELENIIERSVLLATGNIITDVTLPKGMGAKKATASNEGVTIKTMEENERDYIIAVIRKCNGKISGQGGAAALLDINVSTLNSKIKKLRINKEDILTS
jgi:two-component system, NtrC family, response regulator HydG